jgi:hypothetical protein
MEVSLKNLNKEDILKSKIFINPLISWDKTEKGEVMIFLKKRNDILGKIVSIFFLLPKEKIIILDKIGSELFYLLLEKELRVSDIIKYLEEKYSLTSIEAQNSTLEYLKKLNDRGIIFLELKIKR